MTRSRTVRPDHQSATLGESERASEIGVFVGVDMAKTEHFAHATTTDGVELFARPGDQTAIDKLIIDGDPYTAELRL